MNENQTQKLALKLLVCLSFCCATIMCTEITKTESMVLEYKSYLKDKFIYNILTNFIFHSILEQY